MNHCRARAVFTALASVLVIAGCHGPSLLITPVSHKRGLVETVLARDSLFARDKIAIIDVNGVIMNSRAPQLLGEGEHPVSLLLEQLDKAGRDTRVKAVILRIDSPGGTVVASELMHDEISHFRKSGKPVIAVMMGVGASGAYYIACACDEIVAQPSTVTGSIGVLMQMFELSGTLELIGISADAIKSGEHKDTGSLFRALKPEERELFQMIVNEMYDRFVKVVADGRPKLDEPAVRTLADGRIYTASQALELGLIDRIASMREVIKTTKKRIGAEAIRLVAYRRPMSYRPNYYARSPAGDVNLLNVDLPEWFAYMMPRFMYLWSPGR